MKNLTLLTLLLFILIATSCQKEELVITAITDTKLRGDFPEEEGGDYPHEPNPCWDGVPNNLRVLFIGNSFTANFTVDIPTMFHELALESGQSISKVSKSAILGQTLSGHLTTPSTQNLIDQGDWDFVILQENSGFLANANNAGNIFENAVSSLVSEINIDSPYAKILLYQVVPPEAYFLNYQTTNDAWDALFDDVASTHSNVSVTDVAGSFKTAYSSGTTPGFIGTDDILRLPSVNQFHFLNTGGFISAITFYSDIFNDKPCVPAQMTFWLGGSTQGLDDVNNQIFNLEEILQIGYVHGYNSSYFMPASDNCPQYAMYALGNGPCS